MSSFKVNEILVFDTETTGLRHWQGDMPFAVALANEEGDTWYTEWRVDPMTRRVTPDAEDIAFLRKLFSDPETEKVGFNTRFDIHHLNRVGIEDFAGKLHDVGVAIRVCDTLRLSDKLKQISEEYGICGTEDEDLLQKAVNRARREARKRGWNVAKDTEADYWLPRAIDPENDLCEYYARQDVYPRTLMLHLLYQNVVMNDPDYEGCRETYEFEMTEFWPLVRKMETRGIGINPEINDRELEGARRRRDEWFTVIQEMLVKDGKQWWSPGTKVITPFNPGSPSQLARVLYDTKYGYGLPVLRTSKKTREPSTDWKALREYLTHPFVYAVVQYRAADKSVGTYHENYQRLTVKDHVVPTGFCIHCSWNQLGAARTSRTSANDPNIQNTADPNNNPNSPAPIQSRLAFGPRKGYVWYSFDWSQQEVRIFAEDSQEEFMLQALHEGKDINTANTNRAWGGKGNPHALTAAAYSLELGTSRPTKIEIERVWRELGWSPQKAQLFGFSSPETQRAAEKWLRKFNYDIVAAELSLGIKRSRTRGKNLTYAKIYGAGVDGVIDMLYCTREEAWETLYQFDVAFPRIPLHMQERSAKAIELGYVRNFFGRRLEIDPYTAYRAVNYRVQGTAAEQMKRAAIACDRYIESTYLNAHLLAPIHDELIFEVWKPHTYLWFLRGLRSHMEGISRSVLKVPMPVECSRMTDSWAVKEKVRLRV